MMRAMEIDRRTLIAGAGLGVAGGAFAAGSGLIDLGLNGGPSERPLLPRFPQKGEMIVQRVRPPLLETPFSVFDQGTITPNDRHFVRWSGGAMPNFIDVSAFRLKLRGAVKTPVALTLDEVLRAGEHVEVVAVNQCAGNSRGFSEPRVPGAQWGHGAMSNARWRGVRLRDVLDKAGIGGDAKRVRFAGLDVPAVDGAPQKIKSLPIDIARRDDVLVAFAMNGEALPLLNGFPLRLVVPGWFATYWIKMLTDIEVLTVDEDDSYFMAKTYRMPAPGLVVKPGDKDFPTVPITTMGPRSFVTSHVDGAVVPRGAVQLRGIAMGGDAGVAKVEALVGRRTIPAMLGPDEGAFAFRRWTATVDAPGEIGVRCINANGIVQPDTQTWNPSGYARNVVERITLRVA
jgi:DMSO/TMAO reductase YedYZ molybdopterin-dependent catalytic subunit